jgi:hypothetical protein
LATLLECLVQQDQSDKRSMENQPVTVSMNKQFPNHETGILSEEKNIICEKIQNMRNKFLYSNFDLWYINFKSIVNDIDRDLFEFVNTFLVQIEKQTNVQMKHNVKQNVKIHLYYFLHSVYP